MDLKQLRALLAIAETGSVTKASEILHIVQPAISRQVKLLEEELGVVLFERERHGMVPTAAGRKFVERVRRALVEIDEGRREISPGKQEFSGTVVVGYLPSTAEFLSSSLMARLRQSYPHITVRSYVTYLDDLESSLERSEADIALVFPRPDSVSRYPSDKLLEESLYLVGPPDSGLDMDTPVALSELGQVPLILPATSNGIRALVERECTASGVTLNVAIETNSMTLQKNLVLQGMGMSILSAFIVYDEVRRGELCAAPIASDHLRRGLHLARAVGRNLSPAAAKVADELTQAVRTLVAEGRWPGARLA